MNSILPDEPIPHTLNATLESLVSGFNELDSEEQKLAQQLTAQNQKPSKTDAPNDSHYPASIENIVPGSERRQRLHQLIDKMNTERATIKLQNRLILCRLLLINQSLQEVKKDLGSPFEEDGTDRSISSSSNPTTPCNDVSVDEYTRNYDVAGAVEDSHAYQTLNLDNYETLLSDFNKTNEFE